MSDTEQKPADEPMNIEVEDGAHAAVTPQPEPEAKPAAERDESGRFVAKEKAEEADQADPPADGGDDGEENDAEGNPHRLPPGLQKRLAREKRKVERAQGERDAMDASLQELRDLISKGIEMKAFREPVPGDFDVIEDYTKAKARWTKVRDMIATRDEKAEKAAEPAPGFRDALLNLKDVVEGSDKTLWAEVKGNDALQISPHMVIALSEADDPTAALRALKDDPAEAERISKLSPARQMAAVIALKPKPAAPGKRVTQAEDPPSPVSTRAGAPGLDLSKADTETFIRVRNEQEARGGRFGWS